MSQDALLGAAQMEAMADNARDTSQSQAMQALRARLAAGQSDEQELMEACRGFEAIFMNKLWQEMRSTVPRDGYLHSQEEEFYVSLFDQELADKMADAGGVGLADMLFRQLQETASNVSRTTAPSMARGGAPIRPLVPDQPEEAADAAAQEGDFDGSASAMYEGGEEEIEYVALSEVEEAIARGDDVSRAPLQDLGRPGRGSGGDAPADGAEDPVDAMRQAQSLAAGWAGQGEAAAYQEQAAYQGQGMQSPAQESFGQGSPIQPSVMTRVENLAGAMENLRSPGDYAPEPIMPMEGGFAPLSSGPPAADPMAADPLAGDESSQLTWPVTGETASGFGWRVDPYTGRRAFHAGIDVEAPEGSPVESCWDGRVIFAGDRGNYGQMVIVEHEDGWRSYYGHNGSIDVQVGDEVRAGQVIATVGNTGRSTAPHLHFELRQRDMAWDPEQIRQRLMAGMPIGRDG